MSESDEATITSGVFSRRSRLSPKALRIYEKMGLLEPLIVDPSNGYRYYGESQLDAAWLIGLLRRLEMPLDQIKAVVAQDAGDAVKSIGAYWEGVENARTEQRQLVRHVVDRLSRRETGMYTIETRQVPDQTVATIEERVLAPALPDFIGRAMGAIHDALGERGVEPGVPFVAYHGEVNLDADGPVEVCVPYVGVMAPVGDIRLRTEPAHLEAFTRITKAEVAFPRILDAYSAVESWLKKEGRDVSGSSREIYFVDFDRAEPEDPVCDIAFPFERSGVAGG